jgi:CO dehydrogenase/acetyl-CoA synthase delta subunit (corrinoid Fe-S protein)
MQLPDVKETWPIRINTVTIGATKEQGGTRGKTITVGGQTTLPYRFEGQIPNKPVIAGYIADVVPDWPDVLKNAIGKEINNPPNGHRSV